MAAPTAEVVETLRKVLSGPVLAPGDDDYDVVRRIHNGFIDKRPAVIARCTSTADVIAAVNLGRDSGVEISVRGGGHSVAGKAVTDGGLMIDLSLMKAVKVDPAARTIRAEGGVTWAELNDAAHVNGLATTGGVVSTTGIAGLTLGGGVGWLQSKYGMAVDNLLSADLVLASGEAVTVSEATDPDLFWAIRGGGGNFGVATSFEYGAYLLTTVIGGIAAHPLANAPDVLRFYRDITSSASDDLTVYYVLTHAPDGSGTKIVALVVCHTGDDPDAAAAEVKPIKDFGPPIMDMIDRVPYPVQNTLIDGAYPRGALNYWKSAFFKDLSDEAGEKMAKALERAPHPMCHIAIEHYHGAVTRISATATAFPNREPGYNLILAALWEDPSQTDQAIAWARETFNLLRPHMADRVFMNYLDADDTDRIRAAYGPNYARLVELKRRYDPQNVFRLNQNISP
jgi:FAD binding domain-containing protein/berberine-like enzyme